MELESDSISSRQVGVGVGIALNSSTPQPCMLVRTKCWATGARHGNQMPINLLCGNRVIGYNAPGSKSLALHCERLFGFIVSVVLLINEL